MKLVSEYGCPDSTTQELEIQSRPDVRITRVIADSCLNKVLTIKGYENNGLKLISKIWTFSDGSTSTDSIVIKKFSTAGKKDIQLIASAGRFNCKDTTAVSYNIYNSLLTKFKPSSLTNCLNGNLFTFTDSSRGVGQTTSKLRWVITDGFDSTYNPSKSFTSINHQFSSIGKYAVKLLTYNQYGCIDSSLLNVQVNPNPTADFSVDNNTQCLTANVFSFVNSTIANSPSPTLSYYWSFGDSTISASINPVKSYNYDGQKKVKLIALNPFGCKDSITSNIQVKPNPKVKFGINNLNQCVNNNQYVFTDSSSVKSGGGSVKLTWQLGDGSVSNNTTVNKKYTTTGNIKVKLFGTTTFGCVDSAEQIIKLLPKPKSNFYLNKDTQCFVGNLFEFTNTSSIASGGGSLGFQWQFGDGNSSSSAHPNISYSNYGSYSVKLKSTSQFGCVDSIVKNILITANPKVSFAFLKAQNQCNNTDTFVLSNTTQALNGKNLVYDWNFDDGSTSVLKDVRKSYASSGTYFIKLKVSNSIGCLDSATQKVQVYPDPVVDFTINNANQCSRDQKFQFANNTTVGYGGGTLTYKWRYNDTLYATTLNASKTFTKLGFTKIKLIALSSLGCMDSVSKNIQIYPTPIADFSVPKPNQCLNNNKFNLDNKSFISTGNNSYRWSFGDGLGSGTVSPTKVYSKFGNFNIKLVATSDFGCKDSLLKLVKVYSEPSVAFTRSDSMLCLYKNKFTFISKSTNGDSSSMSFKWTFGNGTSDTGSNVKVSYLNSGTYLVKLIALSKNGCSDSSFTNVKIHAQPVPSFTLSNSSQCLYKNTITATNVTSMSAGGGTLSYLWKFGDGSTSSQKNPTWSYSKSNKYIVTLIATSSNQCSDSIKTNTEIYPTPIVGFKLKDSTSCLRNNEFVTTNLSTINYGTLFYSWTFGNNQKSTGLNPKITYATEGKYKIKLISKSSVGCVDSIEKSIEVFPQPKAKFSINNAVQCLNGNNFQLTNSSSVNYGSLTSKWLFGDSLTSTLQDPSHSYKYANSSVIKLIVTSNSGCFDSTWLPYTVNSNPKSNFYLNDSIQCKKGNDFIFYNISKINSGLMSASWNFGDNSIQNSFVGRHSYVSSGFYKVELKMISNFGCTDTISKWISVTPEPEVKFTLNKYATCFEGNKFSTDNSSTYSGSQTVSYFWKFSDGTISNANNLTKSFGADGKYQVTLLGVTSEGCKDSLTKTVTVFPQGKSQVKFFDTVQCLLGNKFTFGNDSRVEGESFSVLSWNYGDGTIDTLTAVMPVSYVYYDTGVFKVELITTTENQCQNTSFGNVRVVPMPQSYFIQNAYSLCSNEQDFTFYATPKAANVVTQKWILDRREFMNIDTLKYNFDNAGVYNIHLVKYTDYGCTDTFKSKVIVKETPVANILSDMKEQCLDNNKFYFNNLSTGNSVPDENWIFYDGPYIDSRTGKSQEVVFDYAGEHLIRLIVENDSMCSDTSSIRIHVNPNPKANIQLTNVCINQPTQILGNATIEEGSIEKYEWNLGDGKNTVDSTPVNTYHFAKKYYINLSLYSLKGCQSKYIDSLVVYPNPIARIAIHTPRATILTDSVSFMDSSENAISYEWNFGDINNTTSTEYAPKMKYSDTGDYKVSLAVVSSDGCYDTAVSIVRVWPDFNLLFPTAFSPNSDQINDDYNAVGHFHSIVDYSMVVYNNEGVKVFETNDVNNPWNGRFMNNGEELPMGNYDVVVRVRDLYDKQFNFTRKVALIR